MRRGQTKPVEERVCAWVSKNLAARHNHDRQIVNRHAQLPKDLLSLCRTLEVQPPPTTGGYARDFQKPARVDIKARADQRQTRAALRELGMPHQERTRIPR